MEVEINGAIVFNFLVSIAVFFIGLWFKRLDNDLKSMQGDIVRIRSNYQRKDLAEQVSHGFEAQLDRILQKLDSIDEKLDRKVDK
ncbi:hypothetical protein [Lonepinella sp. BR2474]|uniref:hypothetical protein n=1 Tax=unclassified Lonepinella TaxID=2642006 RepID=UPI003F6E2605